MQWTIQHKAEFIATLRWLEVFLMETLAGWVPTTPEMEVKVLFGRHLWDAAQHADALGKRAFEMRAPLHYTLAPGDDYVAFLRELAALTGTAERITAAYDVFLPALARRYGEYMERSDSLLDEPTFRIMESALAHVERMQRECAELRRDLPAVGAPAESVRSRSEREASFLNVVRHGAGAALARTGAA